MSEATRTSVTLPGFLGLPMFQPGWVWLAIRRC